MTPHANTLLAYRETRGERMTLESRIMDLMQDGKARTDRQIAHEIGHCEQFRPRITELIKAGQLFEVGSEICDITHKRVRLTRKGLV